MRQRAQTGKCQIAGRNGLLRTHPNNTDTSTYCGRFAPTPSGPLHYGSLVTALASFMQARANRGRWLVRIEDIDSPRCIKGADRDILIALERLGLHWDGTVIRQSERLEYYREQLQRLRNSNLLYPCFCPRRLTRNRPYPGSCRDQSLAAHPQKSAALRIRVDNRSIRFQDHVQGKQSCILEQTTGDFIVLRADGCYSYHLASVTDDADQQVTEVLRGADLIFSTPQQIYLQQRLGLETPGYAHIPVMRDAAGLKLSKQNRAPAIDCSRPTKILLQALHSLHQSPVPELVYATPEELIQWGILHWSLPSQPESVANQRRNS